MGLGEMLKVNLSPRSTHKHTGHAQVEFRFDHFLPYRPGFAWSWRLTDGRSYMLSGARWNGVTFFVPGFVSHNNGATTAW